MHLADKPKGNGEPDLKKFILNKKRSQKTDLVDTAW